MKKTLATIIVMLSSCAPIYQTNRMLEINYSYIDHKDSHFFELSFRNSGKRDICIGAENWPSKSGIIDNDGRSIYVLIGTDRYYLLEEMDYCPDCVYKVKSGEVISGKIEYYRFSIPDRKSGSDKVLMLRSKGYYCK